MLPVNTGSAYANLVLNPVLAVIPEDIPESIGLSVLLQLLGNTRERVNRKLLADYRDNETSSRDLIFQMIFSL